MTAPTPTPAGPAAAPAPAAAPWPRRVLAQASFEARAVLRNGEQLLLTLVLPVLALVVLARTDVVDLGTADRLERLGLVAPGALALAVLSTAFTSQAIATGFDRRWGVLRLLATTPLGRGGLLAGKALAVLAVEVVQVAVLGGVALALGWQPDPRGIPAALAVLVLGTAAFVALALVVAGTLRAEAVLAVANLIWVLLAAGGGALLPLEVLPDGAAGVVALLPSGALGEGLRTALTTGAFPLGPALVLLAWTAAGCALAARFFRWD
jgi:ABC-2 type transport system permease protein